jgi:thymidylate synthase ThyX
MTLLRYRTASTFDVASEEIKLITEAMWQSVIALYPELQQVAESLEKTALSQEKLSSQLEQDCLDYRPQAEKTQYFGPKVILKRSTAVGILGLDGLAIEAIRRAYPFWAAKSDEDVLRLAIQEIGNLNLKLFSPASQALNQISFQFQLTNSLAADMQLQRHRSAQAARPPLLSLPLHDDDFYTPAIFSALPQLESLYQATVQQAIQFARYWINEGVKEAGYLLPNATLIRYDVKEDYLGLLHKAKMRTCFNAQAEAFIQAVEMAQAVSRVAPLLGSYLMPPCVENHQNRDYPVCKEVRYCGIPAWKLANHREFLEKYFSFSV